MAIVYSPSEATDYLVDIIKHNRAVPTTGQDYITPILTSDPGHGKTSIAALAAALAGAQFTARAPHLHDVMDLGGVVMPDRETETTKVYRPFLLPSEPGEVVLLDEFDKCSPLAQNILSQYILAREVGGHRVPAGVTFILCGNKLGSRCGSQRSPSHLDNRGEHIPLETTEPDWQTWALEKGLSFELRSFIHVRPALLSDFNPDAKAFPSPRSVARLDSIIKLPAKDASAEHKRIASCVGEGFANEFLGHMRLCRKLIPSEAILADPERVALPEAGDRSYPSVMYATMMMLAAHTDNPKLDALFKYLNRVPVEYAAVCVRDLAGRFTAKGWKLDGPAYLAWAVKNQKVVLN